ncbi:lipoprotein signal peptidase [Mesoplasma entomophilum]|uniref:signal peptidase II n=1 Tax=Mesoplasma entomophilum TaxID=2149 RepID=UPI000D03A574|nr:signal peptidase II [Mesoplasma entomophilum]AVN60397.1 lipoprotein signal peptidase [Mesoplasma entomophilum]
MLKNWINNFAYGLKAYDFKWKFKLVVATPIMSFLILADWIVKWVVVATMQQKEEKQFIKGFLKLNFIINPGSAYGRNSNKIELAITLATVFVICLMVLFIFLNDKKWIITSSLLLAGGFANLLARSWAPFDEVNKVYGGVVDMFVWDFNFLGSSGYIFNLADMWVNIGIGFGVICFIIEIFYVFKPKKEKEMNKEVEINEIES